MKRLWIIICFAFLAPLGWSQVAIPISGIVVSQYGQPVPGAQIRVCLVTSTGVPCTPTVSIFQDYGLTLPASNPYIADSQGNYTVYAVPIASPGLYLVQVSPQAGTTYSYVVNGNNAVNPVSGCSYVVVGGQGNLNCAVINSVVDAAQFSGSDCGAKINSADSYLGSTAGEIDVNQACGTTWTTQVVLSANHNLVFTQAGTYIVPGISALGFNIIDLKGSELQMPAYSTVTTTAGMIGFYNGSSVGSNVTIENGILDGNWANTPSANTCLFNQCRPLVAIDNGSNAASVHDIYMENVTFTHSNNAPVALVNHYPLPYNITVEGSRFEHLGAEGFYSAGWWKNLFIRNDHFSDWGTGITAGHADGIVTFDYTGYGGTSQYTMDLSGTTFDPTTQPPDGYGFAAEIGAGGAGWTSDLTMENNHFNDGGTGNGGSVSGEFKTATISGNDWTNGGPCELLGNNITVTGNTIKNGTILRYPWIDLADTGGVISGNTIEMVGPMYSTCGHPSYINQTAISVGGLGTVQHPVLTQAIRQTAQSFTVSSISCTTQTVANVPPTEILNGTFSGGASNGYLNWAFTISGAMNNGNNGVLVAAASTGSTLTFVNPMCVTETTSAATAVSSATTTDYVGSFGGSNNVGSLNGLVGQDRVYVRDFVNAGNNTNTTVTGTSFAYTTIGGRRLRHPSLKHLRSGPAVRPSRSVPR